MKMLYLLLTSLVLVCFFQIAFAGKKDAPQEIIGTWEGNGVLFLPLAKEPPPSKFPDDSPLITLTINDDGTVDGNIGNAVLKNCVAKSNRGWFGRWLNIKTDYIIKNGYLEGSLSPVDSVQIKKFTMPFNVKDGKIAGTVMQIFRWNYPKPLVRVIIPQKNQ